MVKLIKIGNSQGIRLPKNIIEEAKLQDCEIALKLCDEGLLLKPLKASRKGWDNEQLKDALMMRLTLPDKKGFDLCDQIRRVKTRSKRLEEKEIKKLESILREMFE
ncbi:hypothetical protein [Campylobacter sp. MIT 99-7217]|uniref:AbrB/MazE/SpoVT family DNA-binding domain-containing protein n=1 Tax=Campylobacter sp. MIT 99-7217 TaxID=535091 RepID=UPI001C8EBE12|nr:hypothetical protein [Campylobacter sp. MIT 99-7217]